MMLLSDVSMIIKMTVASLIIGFVAGVLLTLSSVGGEERLDRDVRPFTTPTVTSTVIPDGLTSGAAVG
jgi:ABC-type arginine/histidine transport system permease subunit